MSNLKQDTRAEAEALLEAKERLEEAVDDLPEEDALFEQAQMNASQPPLRTDRDRQIRDRFRAVLEEVSEAEFQFRQAVREYETAVAEHHKRLAAAR